MAPPASWRLRRILATVAIVSFSAITHATTFPLSIPTRPTTFPLVRPALAGEVVAWGSNNFSQIIIPASATNVVAIAAGLNHSLALRADGTVVAWGDNRSGQCDVPLGLTGIVGIAGGAAHSLALKSDGRVVAWGTVATDVPANLTDAVAIGANADSSFALKQDGTVVRWGLSSTPIPNPSWTNIVAIRGVYRGCSAIRGDGAILDLQEWDRYPFMSDVATIGSALTIDGPFIRTDGSIIHVIYEAVPVGLRATAIATARYNFTAIKGDSTVVAWGFDPNLLITNVPPRLRGVIAIEGGDLHFLALRLSTPPIPTTARASAQIVNGFIVGMNILDGGEGYAVPPQVTISGGGGSGATATAQISKGVVTGFTITNAGIGYTSTPTVEIEPPPFLPKLSIATSRVGVTMQVVPGKRYQLESSNDLPNFGPVGAPFVADKDTIFQEFTVSETGQYFRIVEVP